ncbi:MAG: hypothetical protein NC918_03930 [Candidatus Omnitrophica bacterium]|nr:hypothetical protein [Candidatus Omnitrophota bacterium]
MQAKNTKIFVTLFILFFLNFLTGLIFINEGLFHYDAVVLAKAVENTYKFHKLQPAVSARYGAGIVNSIIYFPFYILGETADFSVRFTSVLFGSLSIVALFLFVFELGDNFFIAFVVSLLFSFTPFYFSPNTYGKEHGICNFFLFLSWTLVLKGIKKNSLFFLILSSLFFIFTISIRESALVTTPWYFLLYFLPKISKPFRIQFNKNSLKLKNFLSFFFRFFNRIFIFLYLKPIFYRELFVKDIMAVNFLGLYSPILRTAFRDLFKAVPVLLFIFSLVGFLDCFLKKIFFCQYFYFLGVVLFFILEI